MNGPRAMPQHRNHPACGFSLPPSNTHNSWNQASDYTPSNNAKRTIPSHTTQTYGWCAPSVSTIHQPTWTFPEPSNVRAPDAHRHPSAPASDFNPSPLPFSSAAPPYITQDMPGGRMPFPEPQLYPSDEKGHFHHSSVLATSNFVEEPQMMTPESTSSILSPATPDHITFETGLIKSDMLEAAVTDIQVVQKVFLSWCNQLKSEAEDHAKTKTPNSFKDNHSFDHVVLPRIDTLLSKVNVLLETSQSVQETHARYVRALNGHHQHSHHQFQSEIEDAEKLSADLAKGSDEVLKYVNDIRNEICDLVKTIRDAKEVSDKKASRDKVLHTIVNSLKIINVGVGVGASVSQIAPQPAGLVATVALGTASVLIASVTELTDRFRKVHYSETEFDAALKLIDRDIPDALKKAELTLCSFRATQKHMTLDKNVREAIRSNPNDAESRRKAWQKNGLQTEGLPSMVPLTRSTRP